ncbi:glucose-6-phosphate 1-dehydrogenase Zwf [Thermoanaerobacter kivui]|uniref:Glucose-6-phosphate 1-dehydrogenase n=1 Tax=Thermoanaerobacter kivui TaxID=2325 RepID=A0A097AR31_THEKI|nr:glucose-6-phosphate dehydrogenase [Thermoanaerobacter kivui]AIS52253.1 glucose-6-phosphate 1-dehydrogenase Zwf [Thermoanaerobacter kivui]
MVKNNISNIMVIFGGRGDLTHRKLMPALYNLKYQKILPENFAVVSIGRRDKTEEQYRNEVLESVKNYSRFNIDEKIWQDLSKGIYYKKFDFTDGKGYIELSSFLEEIDKKYNAKGNRVYYLAVAPEYFGIIVEKLNRYGMVKNETSWQRVVIEKPFGEDLKSAQRLNKIITDVFTERNTYRIDHYLGKEMLQNIIVIRFANVFFEPVWNRRYIDNVQISSNETVGIENRGGYYEKAGALRDMVQNHMLQLLTLTAMEPPVNLDTESIRDEKVKVLKSLEIFTPGAVEKNIVRGQYVGYRQEDKVSPTSNTETFMALKVHVENFRWAGVPFYIRTGKRMPAKSTEIVIQFKPLPGILSKVITKCKVFDFTNIFDKITSEDLVNKNIQKGNFIIFKTRNSLVEDFDFEFVYLDKSGALYLKEKEIVGVGIDALGIERSQPDHETHKILLEAGIVILEGLRLKDVEEGEYFLYAAPLKIKGAEAAPTRAVLIKEE